MKSEEIGQRVYEARKLRKMTQQNLGKKLGVSFQQIQKYERGHNRIPSTRLYDISKALDMNMGYFFGEDLEVGEDMRISNEGLLLLRKAEQIGRKRMDLICDMLDIH